MPRKEPKCPECNFAAHQESLPLSNHDCCPAVSWRVYDAQAIYLCRVCAKCEDVKMSRYRPEILTGYTQADVDEQIEPS